MRDKILRLMDDVFMLPEGSITEDSTMENTLEWDSLAHVLLMGELESRLGLSIPIEDAIEITDVKQLFERLKV
ncbi:MAG: acyl carrier protein [Lachnospiraceae bacterium]|nr:acyl carrier protein [Lachnospiraceae bacterium]